ncbi:MAG: hypothetical protein WC711_03935 [Candidatus Staskawiczbacteria bacterium]|jgi:hypothetical protein
MEYKSENKVCQNCKKDFVVEPDDFAFYEKMKVPAPTWCPECRIVRRFMWRNEQNLFRRKCQTPGHNEYLITIFHPDAPVIVYDQEYWWSDKWDVMSYGRDYDFSKPFFEQFDELLHLVPLPHVANTNSPDCEYCHSLLSCKDCYMTFVSDFDENVMYTSQSNNIKDSMDCFWLSNSSEKCYELVDSQKCYNVKFSRFAIECRDSSYLYDCRDCSNCFACVGLRSKKYYIFNQPYSKEEYFNKVKNISAEEAIEFINSKPRSFCTFKNAVNCSGENINHSRNCKNCFGINEGENLRWVQDSVKIKDAYDCFGSGYGDLINDSMSILGSRISYSKRVWYSNDVQYSYYCYNSSDLFGCIGLRKKKHCIFNKQYSKDEYIKLREKIIEHMKKTEEYGQFFPLELSPFAYNETLAQDYFPLTEKEAKEKGYLWREKIKTEYNGSEDSVFKCKKCDSYFKIIEREQQFYDKMSLQKPEYCFSCRHNKRLSSRTPFKLWNRQCTKCKKEIETSYAPDRPEIVYCEQCYNQEVA